MSATQAVDPFSRRFELAQADQDLLRAYRMVNRFVDDLAYTSDFERLYQMYQDAGNHGSKHEVFRRLLTLRKAGLLPRLFTPTDQPAGS